MANQFGPNLGSHPRVSDLWHSEAGDGRSTRSFLSPDVTVDGGHEFRPKSSQPPCAAKGELAQTKWVWAQGGATAQNNGLVDVGCPSFSRLPQDAEQNQQD